MSFYLSQFASQHFRNLQGDPVTFHPRFNLIHGANGQGKTNLLEAIYYLFTLRPMRPVRPRQLIAWGEYQAQVQGQVHGRVERTLNVTFSRRERQLSLNGAPPLQLDDYFEDTQVVAFAPEDIQLVRGAPELRRRWLDRAVFNSDITYLTEVRQFLRLLGHRNALLKEVPLDDTLFEVIDAQFVVYSARIIRRRQSLLQRLRPHLKSAFARIFPEEGLLLDIEYQANVTPPGIDPDLEPQEFEQAVAEALQAQINRQQKRERERKSSLVGPHLDDVMFTFQGYPFKISASQGQTRALVLSLKIAEILEIQARIGHHPIFILDDVAGELDPQHSAFLFSFLEETHGQVLLSTTNLKNIHLAHSSHYNHILVHQGKTSLTNE